MHLVETAIQQFDWSNKKLLVGCSGGLDSVVLVHALKQHRIPFAILHVNYQLRGKDSEDDEQFVRLLSQESGVPILVVKCPIELTQGPGINLQNAAREFRRTLFDQWKSLGEQYHIVLAHHLDDQTETFFLQYYRGSGMIGLSGMKPERNRILRPFLDLHKEDLKRYAVLNKIEWREDQSNASNKYLRNLFRNTLLPSLKNEIPELENAIGILQSGFKATIREENEFIQELHHQIASQKAISSDSWNKLSETQKALLIRELDVPHWGLERIEQLFKSALSAHAEIGEITLIKANDGLLLNRRSENVKVWEFKIEAVEQLPEHFDNSVLYCTSEIAESQLQLRNAKKEDKIYISGLPGRKSVWQLLKERGVPAQLRAKQLVLSSNGEIIWVPCFAVSKNVLVKNADSSTVKITVVEKNQQSRW